VVTKRKTLSLLVAVVFVLSLGAPAFGVGNPDLPEQAERAFDQKVISRIDAEKALEHIQALQDIGTRPAGSENEHEAVEYIYDYYEDLGYEVEKQEFSVAEYGGPENMSLGLVEITDGEEFFGEVEAELGGINWTYGEHHGIEWETMSAPEGAMVELTADLYYCGDGEPGDFPEEIENNIALIEVDWGNATDQVENAIDAGAEGVIFSTFGQAFMPPLDEEFDIPVLGASSVHGDWLQEMLEEETMEINLETYTNKDLISYNVVATKEAKSDDAPVIVVTGHLDSVPGAPGANDNASGTATAMELARVLQNYNTEMEIRFVNVGAEEVGFCGAFHYVDQLSEAELDRHYANYNPDMVATSDPDVNRLWRLTVDGEENLVTESTAAADERLGYEISMFGELGRSDHVPFHLAGIPAALFIWLGEESTPPSPLVLEPTYHTPLDTIEENICIERFDTALNIIGAAVFDEARKEVPAFERTPIREEIPARERSPLQYPRN